MTSTMRRLGVGIAAITLIIAVFVPTIASAERRRGGHHDRDDNTEQTCVSPNEELPEVVGQEDAGRRPGRNDDRNETNRRHHDRRETCATAEPATFDPSTCGALGTYTILEATGVDYTINDAVVAPGTYTATNGTTVTIVAVAQEGFAFEEGAVTSWTYTYNVPTNCATVTTTSTTPQVTVTPVGGVSAGAGGATQADSSALFGFVLSLGAVAFGIIRKATA